MSTVLEHEDQNQKQLKRVVTLCKNCIFKTVDEITGHQIGCQLDRLELYKEHNIDLINTESADGNFYTINGRICTFCRDARWKDKYEHEIISQLTKETTLSYDVIIISNGDYRSAKRTIQSLEKQLLLPKKVTVILDYDEEHNAKSLVDYFFENRKFSWKLRKLTTTVDPLHIVDNIVENQQAAFYSLCAAGFSFRRNVFSKLDYEILYELKQHPAILPDADGNGLICQTFTHKLLGGNREKPITQKLKELNWNLTTITKLVS